VLLNVSNSHLFWQGREPEPIEPLHRPSFLAFPRDPGEPIHKARSRLLDAVGSAQGKSPDEDSLAKVHEVLEPVRYKSFWNHGASREVIPVASKRSYWVPDVSDKLFADLGFYTCEHDIPYTERAAADLAAERDWWILDTKGAPRSLKVLTYDIETTQYAKSKEVPIDMIGYADFDVEFSAQKDLETEAFDFQFRHIPNDWAAREVHQLVARTPDEEIDNLAQFTQHVVAHDVVAGHNILGFDNKQIHDRIVEILQRDQRNANLSPNTRSWFQRFTNTYSRPDRSFHFGTSQDIATWYPISLDTFHAARKFYFFHDDFTLKGLAPWLGIEVPDRIYLDPHEMGLDAKTMLYNKHDIQEQLGLTMNLIAQALPLAFTVNMGLEELLTGGNTRMWDHMALIRARRNRKIMPATCRAQGVARGIQRVLPGVPFPTREQVAQALLDLPAVERQSSTNKELLRVAKQGPEMPFWCEHPGVIASQGEQEGYAIPGGMTLKPDSELKSHFVPWYHVVAADVGAMYPTILKAKNLTADTVVPARKGETVDDWIWLFELDPAFRESGKYEVRPPDPAREGFTKGRGWMIGVRHNPEPGMVNLAMTGVMDTIQKVKRARAEAKRDNRPKDEVRIHDMTYASLKAARNAGTHGILVAVNVSCRQFNVWGGANITTIGQRILYETLEDWESKGIRAVYGDSVDGARSVVVQDPQGRTRVLPLARLWDAVGSPVADVAGKQVKPGAGWKALAMEGEKAGWHPLVRIIRHDVDRPLWRIGQRDGETVCTDDHSLMVRRDGIVRARPDEALQSPMVRVRAPRTELSGRIDLAEWIAPLGRALSDQHGKDRRFGHSRDVQRFHFDDQWIWYGLTPDPTAHPRLRRHVEVGSPECSALMRLLGAYVAEGSVHWSAQRRGASIAQSDDAWLKGLESDYHLLFEGASTCVIPSSKVPRQIATKGGVVTYQDETKKLQMSNGTSALAFWALGGKTSRGKRVWDVVFNLPMRHQWEFLEKAVEGDGSRAWGPRYRPDHDRHFRYETASQELASGLSVLLGQLDIDHGIRYRPSKGTHRISTRDRPKPQLRSTLRMEQATGPVYDLEVEDAHTFVDAMGCILLHNTDGLYMGCSKSAGNVPHFAAALGADLLPEADKWITMPDAALETVAQANRKWRDELQYEGFELEAETHDCMVFVVHKNYLIFDADPSGNGVKMETKGNNFKGSDKAPLAQDLLRPIMAKALRDVASWDDEEKARESMKVAIKKATREVMQTVQVAKTDREDLTLRQAVSSVKSYEPNPDGTLRVQAVRAAALEDLLGEPITSTRKMKFIVCRDPLPLYKDPVRQERKKAELARSGHILVVKEPKNRGLKPIEYMWPIEHVKDTMIDWAWYKNMVEDYVKGAFGFDNLELATQRDLSSWF
jgi:DNA polymerase elongation subunit (family B)